MLRTRTFTLNIADEENLAALREDLEAIRALKADEWPNLLEAVEPAVLASSKQEILQKLHAVEDKDTPRHAVMAMYRLANYFLRILAHHVTSIDSSEDLTSDLVELKVIRADRIESVGDLLRCMKKRAKDFQRADLRERTKSGVLPAFVGCGTTVEIRGVFERQLRLGEKALDLSSMADPIDHQTVVSVTIFLDIGAPDFFSFQSDPKALQYLVEKLQFALMQAEALERDLVGGRGDGRN